MKQFFNILLILFLGLRLYAQQPQTYLNSINGDSLTFIQYLPIKSDFVLAYSEESYWWSNTENFKLLTRKENEWTIWTYKRKWKSSSDVFKNNGKKKKRYFRKISNVDSLDVNELFDNLKSIGFWELPLDSLNSIRGNEISDLANYRFRIETISGAKLIESYAPDYYIKEFPDMRERILFIRGRDVFKQWWKNQSR